MILGYLSKQPGLRPQSADELSERLLACRDARRWSRAEAQAWWAAHRDAVRERVRERGVGINGSLIVEAADETPG